MRRDPEIIAQTAPCLVLRTQHFHLMRDNCPKGTAALSSPTSTLHAQSNCIN